MSDIEGLVLKIRNDKSIWFSEWHGVTHWERVRRNGRKIAESNGGDLRVVDYFAYLHDCCRINEDDDPEHGHRAVRYAEEIRELIKLPEPEFNLLSKACRDHTFVMPKKGEVIDPTLAACWDGDRLDLPRVGISPDPDYLFSDFGKAMAERLFSSTTDFSDSFLWV